MALEDDIQALTEAVNNLRETMEGLASAKSGGATDKKTTSTKSTGSNKSTGKSTGGSKGRPKKVKPQVVHDAFGAFFNSGEDKEDMKRLIEVAKPVLEHLGVSRVGEIEDDDVVAEAHKIITELQQVFDDEEAFHRLGKLSHRRKHPSGIEVLVNPRIDAGVGRIASNGLNER